MQAIRCSCGAMHSPDAVHRIGRQYGLDGEYMDLGNCPSCGSTICLASKSACAPSKRRSARTHSRAG
jgi:hypothetical protein